MKRACLLAEHVSELAQEARPGNRLGAQGCNVRVVLLLAPPQLAHTGPSLHAKPCVSAVLYRVFCSCTTCNNNFSEHLKVPCKACDVSAGAS